MPDTESRTIEIRAAEGGEDARLFVAELASAYQRLAERMTWKSRADTAPNLRTGHQALTITVQGQGLSRLDNEAGGHRLQRVPPTERRGRVHTSTVTVAVIGEDAKGDVSAYQRRGAGDFRVEWYNGTVKAGGQHHQKNATCCRLTHLPTGIVKTAQTRSRNNSEKLARAAVEADLDHLVSDGHGRAVNGLRRAQVGSGQRGDKRRTYRFQEDAVTDHASGIRARASDVMEGRFDLLWA